MKYLYLDDESGDETSVFVDLLQDKNSDIEIDLRYPLPFSEQIQIIKDSNALLDGLILDLRLDQVANDKKRADYRALTVAQEYRTRVTEGSFKALPLILCSTDNRLNVSYKKDETGHDLFDVRYLKSEFVSRTEEVANEIWSLANGYKEIIQIKTSITARGEHLHTFFKLNKEQLTGLDKRLLHFFGTVDGKMPEHEYARLLLREMIMTPSVLIDETLLAARLGIDMQASEDWNALKSYLSDKAGYLGPFREAWPRWWMHLINIWWYNLKEFPAGLQFLTATERVNFIKKATKFKKLVPLTPYKKNYSSRFWSICKALKVPIDPLDGLMADGKMPFTWQEKEYISVGAAIERINYKEGVRVHPLEADRLSELKKEMRTDGKN